MKKYKFKGLSIEVTRRCNLRCEHCMRGEPQNVTITKEIIDKVFESAEDCEKIIFTGGEPFLEPEIIEYFVDRIIESGWTTKLLTVVTNGTIENEHIVDAFKRFCNSGNNRAVVIYISFDAFHSIETSTSAYVFYKNAVGEDTKISVFPLKDIEKPERQFIVFSGRAVQYIEKHPELFYPRGEITPLEVNRTKHRITIVDGEVFCLLQVGATGNIIFGEDGPYDDEESSIGNILNGDLCDIIDLNNDNCVLLCTDYDMCTACRNAQYSKKVDELEKLVADSIRIVVEEIINIRRFVHCQYPAVPVETIIEMLPIPKQNDWYLDLFFDMYKESEYFKNPSNEMLSHVKKRFLASFIKQKDGMSAEDRLCWMEALAVSSLLNDKKENRNLCAQLEKRGLFGSKVCNQLKELNEKYECGEISNKRQKVFPCDSIIDR